MIPTATRKKPRRWQSDALAAWKSSGLRGIASVVTGAGKTFFAMRCMIAVWGQYPEAKVLIIVPTVALMDQWRIAIQDELRIDDADINLLGGGMRGAGKALVTVAVLDSARKFASEITGQGQWFLVVDECHRIASPANRKILEGKYIATLGLSATPERQYDDLFETVIIPSLGPVVFRYEYEEASADGIISDFELWNIRVPATSQEQEQINKVNRAISMEVKQLRVSGFQSSPRLKNFLMQRSRRSQRVRARISATLALAEQFKGRKGFIFHESIQSADEITDGLVQNGNRARVYHSKLGTPTRYLNLLLYIRDQIDVLVACRALDEGIDVPRADFGIISASTSSIRQRIQRLGRVLRPHSDKQAALVATMYVLPSEAEVLRLESEKLEGVAEVRWFEAS